MTLFAIIFWSIIGCLFIAFIFYESRQRRKRRKQKQEEKQKKEEIFSKISEYQTRHYRVRKVFLIIAGPKLFLKADELLDQIDEDYYECFDYEYLQKNLKRVEKEIEIVESAYNDYMEKLTKKQQKESEFEELSKKLEDCLCLCDEQECLTQEQQIVLTSIRNRLTVDQQKIQKNPQQAIKRTQSSLKKLTAITSIASSNGGGFFYGD